MAKVTYSAANFCSGGQPVPVGTSVVFTPVLAKGVATAFNPGSGITSASPVSVTVATAGEFSIELDDTTATAPANIGWAMTAFDPAGVPIPLPGYGCLQNAAGVGLVIDAYPPNLAPQVPFQAGPQGLSAYQVYQANGGQLSETDWVDRVLNSFGRNTAASSIAQYANTNPSNLYASDSFNPGLAVYADGTNAMGLDVSPLSAGNNLRLFASTNFGFVRAWALEGTNPAPGAFTNIGDLLTTGAYKVFPDSSGNNALLQLDKSTGLLTLAHSAVINGQISAPRFNSTNTVSDTLLNGVFASYFDSANGYGSAFLVDTNYHYVQTTFAASNGKIGWGFHQSGTPPTSPADINTFAILASPTRIDFFPDRTTGVGTIYMTSSGQIEVAGRSPLFATSTAPSDTTSYVNVNPAGLLSNSLLNPGLSLFSASNNAFGMDVGNSQFGLSTRIYAPDAFGFELAWHQTGTEPTAQSSFNHRAAFITTNQWKFYPDASGTPKAQIDSNGNLSAASITVNGSSPVFPSATAPASTSGYVKLNPSNLATFDTALAGGATVYADTGNAYGLDFMANYRYLYGPRLFAADNGSIAFAFHTAGTIPTAQSSITNYGMVIQPTLTQFYPNYSTNVAPATLDHLGNFVGKSFSGALVQAAGSNFVTSDAVLPNSAATLVQLQAYLVSRSHEPAVGGKSWAGWTDTGFGDSITAGFELVDPNNAYMVLSSAALGTTLNNHATPGDQTADCANKVFGLANYNASAHTLCTVAIGTNDIYQNTPSAGQEQLFNLGHQAILTWLSTRAENRVDAGTVTGTNWAQDATFAAVTGTKSSTSGASTSYTLTTYGAPIYVWYRLVAGGGTFNLTVASGGSTVATASASTTPPVAIATFNGGTSGVGLLRLPIAAGTYTLTLTNTTAAPVTIVSMGTMSAHTLDTSPTVLVGGVLPFYGDASQALTAQYTADIIRNILLIQADGGDVRLFDNRPAMQDGLSTLYAGLNDLHPGILGHAAIAPTRTRAALLPPGRAVRRSTPVNGTLKGTPGLAWSDGSYNYLVQPDGTVTRSAVTYATF